MSSVIECGTVIAPSASKAGASASSRCVVDDLIMLVMTDRGADKLLATAFTLGAEGSVAAGPVGRTVTAQTDAQLHADILSCSRSQGLFAGLALELERRDRLFRGGRRPPIVGDRTVILVDDGLATGSTMEAAIVARRSQAPAQIVVAVPVGARETCDRIGRMADRVVSSRRRNRSMRSASGTNSSARRAMKK